MDTRPPRFLVIVFDLYGISVRRFSDPEAAHDYAGDQLKHGYSTVVSEQVRQTASFGEMRRVDAYLDRKGSN